MILERNRRDSFSQPQKQDNSATGDASFPKIDLRVTLQVDASVTAVGGVLSKEGTDGRINLSRTFHQC